MPALSQNTSGQAAAAQERWIVETLSLLDNPPAVEMPVSLSHALTEQVRARVLHKPVRLRPAAAWSIAASIALLVGINIVSLAHFHANARRSQTGTDALYTAYFSPLVPY